MFLCRCATGTVHPTRSADSQEFCRSVMENSEPSASRSDLGLGIIDTACLFCVAGSDWWANFKSLLEDFGLKHEIDETREAERDTNLVTVVHSSLRSE